MSTLFKIYKLPILPGIRETAENLGKFEYNSLHWPGHDGNWSYYNIRRNRREGIQNYSAQETFQTHTNSNKSTLEYSQRRVSTLFLMDKKEAKKFWFSSNPNFPHFEGNSRTNVSQTLVKAGDEDCLCAMPDLDSGFRPGFMFVCVVFECRPGAWGRCWCWWELSWLLSGAAKINNQL